MILGNNITEILVRLVASNGNVICNKNEDFKDKPYKLITSVSVLQTDIPNYEEISITEYTNRYMQATGKTYTDIVKEMNNVN